MNRTILKRKTLIVFFVIMSLMIVSFVQPDIRASEEPASAEVFSDTFAVEGSSDDSEDFAFAEELFSTEEAFAPDESEEPGSEPGTEETTALSSLILKHASLVYTGSPRTQSKSLTVTAEIDGQETVLTRGTDYTVSYKNNTEIGIATVTVKGIGNYTGTLKKKFRIIPPKTAIRSVNSGTRRITVKWKTPPASADGIKIQYSTKKDFSSGRTNIWIRTTDSGSRTITGLNPGKTYYVRLCSYKKVNGTSICSEYGKVLSVKLKKNAITVKKSADGKRTIILDNAVPAENIRFAVWSANYGQDDLVWYTAKKASDGKWKATFKVSKHRNDGKFYVKAYSGDSYLSKASFSTDASETATGFTALAGSLKIASETRQLILVGAEGTSCTLTMLNKNADGTWHQLLTTSGNVGLNGIGEVTEWNRKTPVGVYGFCEAFGIYDDPGTKLKYTKVDSTYYWVDDVNSPYYNQFVTTKKTPVSWSSAEHIIDYTGSYQYCLALDFNKECIPGAGSAIFLHAGSGSPTLGCIAVPLNQMKKIMQCVRPGCKIIIDTPDNLKNY